MQTTHNATYHANNTQHEQHYARAPIPARSARAAGRRVDLVRAHVRAQRADACDAASARLQIASTMERLGRLGRRRTGVPGGGRAGGRFGGRCGWRAGPRQHARTHTHTHTHTHIARRPSEPLHPVCERVVVVVGGGARACVSKSVRV